MKLTHLALAIAFGTLNVGAFAQPLGELHRHADLREGQREIDQRLRHQGERIFFKLRAGSITPARAAALRGEEDRVRNEMRLMAAHHGGFLTSEDRMMLNHRLDEISRHIGV